MTLIFYIIPDLTTSLIFVVCFLSAWILLRRKNNLPPGPFSLPFLGTLPWLGTDVREPLKKLQDKYGDVFTVYLGPKPAVMLCSQEAIKEAYVKCGNVCSGRPQDLFFIKELTFGRGVVSSEGEVWRQQRKFTHNILREFGMGKSILEEKIHEELDFFIEEIKKTNGEAFNPHLIVQSAVSNVICNIVYGSRYQYDDPVFQHHMDLLNQSFEIVGNAGPLTVFPFLRHLPGDLFRYKWLKNATKYTRKYDRERIDEHRKTGTPGVIRDVIDAYLIEMDKEKDDPKSSFNDLQLLQIIGDLFSAGTETTATTLRWGLVFLLHHPEVQQKISQEIQNVIGPDRMPSMKDKSSMPYTEACLLEIQRMGDIVPLGMPHTVTEDVEFRGYMLPKGTEVYSNLYCVHHDPKTFDDPYNFKPERFLDEDGKVCRRETIIPFSMGKRVCLGESLARMELFLFFTSLIQHFNFVNPKWQSLPSTTGKLGITNLPHSFEIIAEMNRITG